MCELAPRRMGDVDQNRVVSEGANLHSLNS